MGAEAQHKPETLPTPFHGYFERMIAVCLALRGWCLAKQKNFLANLCKLMLRWLNKNNTAVLVVGMTSSGMGRAAKEKRRCESPILVRNCEWHLLAGGQTRRASSSDQRMMMHCCTVPMRCRDLWLHGSLTFASCGSYKSSFWIHSICIREKQPAMVTICLHINVDIDHKSH